MGCDLALVAQVEARLESVRHRGGIFAGVLPNRPLRLSSLVDTVNHSANAVLHQNLVTSGLA